MPPASSEGSLSVCRLTVSVLWMLLSLGCRPLETSVLGICPPEASCCCTSNPWKGLNAQVRSQVQNLSAIRVEV